jgi:hypothetical protein
MPQENCMAWLKEGRTGMIGIAAAVLAISFLQEQVERMMQMNHMSHMISAENRSISEKPNLPPGPSPSGLRCFTA